MEKTTKHFLRAGFSLVELLVVIAVLGILTGLAVPAMKGLAGVSGVRGGANSLSAAFDQARYAAIENATPTYLGFPSASFSPPSNPALKYSSMIIFREKSPNDPVTDPDYKPLSRWITLPPGVLFDLSGASLDSSIGAAVAPLIPQLDGLDVPVDVIKFDKYGKIVGGTVGMSITIGTGILGSSGPPVFPNKAQAETYVIQRLTGRLIAKSNVPK
jgi:prepilin-type N-terminal cleavage/methylation domain-containing protein